MTRRAGSLRDRLGARLARWRHWEFWPAWMLYLPIVPHILTLAIKHRGLTTPTAANPGIPHGGVVGESKFDILGRLPNDSIVPSALLSHGAPEDRLKALQRTMTRDGWSYPIILKPDVGERGAGVRLIRDDATARSYLETNTYPVLAQVYHPGPFEAGVFYYRYPGVPTGHIFSITDKRFPVIHGDGRSTLAELIWRHPRYRLQADRFLARLNGQADRVLTPSEPYRLAIAGNHCQGTMFQDGRHLWTLELEVRVDEIAKHFDGFYFGRFDVRYSDVTAFKAGHGFSIIELNGISSESTNIYDPRGTLRTAHDILRQQWDILFDIGARNRARGIATTPAATLWQHVRAYYEQQTICAISD